MREDDSNVPVAVQESIMPTVQVQPSTTPNIASTRKTDIIPTAAANIKRGNPDKGDWVTPKDYKSHDEFVLGEVRKAYKDHAARYKYVQLADLENLPWLLTPTSEVLEFKNQTLTLTMQSLYGSTVVLVVSTRGAWMCHLYETLLIDPPEGFDGSIGSFLLKGAEEPDALVKLHKYGLTQLRGVSKGDSIGRIFGDNEKDMRGTKVYIFTPRPRVAGAQRSFSPGASEMVGITDKPLSDAQRQDENANAGKVLYQQKIDQIKEVVLKALQTPTGKPSVEVIDYAPMVPTLKEVEEQDKKEKEQAEKNAKRDTFTDTDNKSHRGKLILQYQPAECDRKSAWQFWVEGRDLGSRHVVRLLHLT